MAKKQGAVKEAVVDVKEAVVDVTVVKGARWLKYKFSAEETAEFAQELARKNIEIGQKHKKKTEVVKSLAAEIAAVESSIALLSGKVHDGYEYRDIEVEKSLDYSNGTVTVTRTDTGVVIEERAMTEEERQKDLVFDNNGNEEEEPVAEEPENPTGGAPEDAEPGEWTLEKAKEADHLCTDCTSDPAICDGEPTFIADLFKEVTGPMADKVLVCGGYFKKEDID